MSTPDPITALFEVAQALEDDKKCNSTQAEFDAKWESFFRRATKVETILALKQKLQLCEVCWTSSWAPCEKEFAEHRNAIARKDNPEEYEFCQYCEQHDWVLTLAKRLEELEKENDESCQELQEKCACKYTRAMDLVTECMAHKLQRERLRELEEENRQLRKGSTYADPTSTKIG